MYRLIVYGLLKDLQFFHKLTGKRPHRVDPGTFRARIEIVEEDGPSSSYSYPVALLDSVSRHEVCGLCLTFDLNTQEVLELEKTLSLYESDLYDLSETEFKTVSGDTRTAKIFIGRPEILSQYSRRTAISPTSKIFSWPPCN